MNKKMVSIFTQIEDWVKKDGNNTLPISAGEHKYVFIKGEVVTGLVSIFCISAEFSKSLFEELNRGNADGVGHYIPKLGKFLGFYMYIPGITQGAPEIPENNICVSDVAKKIAEKFSWIIQKRVKAELDASQETYVPTRSQEAEEEALAEYWTKGIEETIFWKHAKFPENYIEFEDVVNVLLSDKKDIIENIFDQKYRHSSKGESTYDWEKTKEMMRRYYTEKMKTYIPRETDVAFKRQGMALKKAFEGKPAPKKVRMTVERTWNDLNSQMKKLIPETKDTLLLEIEFDMESVGWRFNGIANWDYKVVSPSNFVKKEYGKRVPVLQSAIPYSAIREIRYGRKVIYKK